MKLAIMQPYLFPYIGYWQLLHAADKFVVLDDVNFIKKGWINRNNILVNGKAQLFTVPLRDVSQNRLILEVETSEDIKWKEKFMRTLEMAYRKAPFYEPVSAVIARVIMHGEKRISAVVLNSFREVLGYLGLEKAIVESSAVYNNGHLRAGEKILDICLKEKATHYINPIGGKDLYVKEKFEGVNIRLNFIRSRPFEYRQFGQAFVPWLSIIDVLMFNPPGAVVKQLGEYDLE